MNESISKGMETITTTQRQFNLCKKALDGLVFWRELPDDKIQIKFIPCYLDLIHPTVIKFLTNDEQN